MSEPRNGRTTVRVERPGLPGAPAAPPRSVPAPSFLAERYEDLRFIGEGGMGTVYRAWDPNLGRPVALKLLKGADPELWPRFLAEARAQAQVEHENVCRVFETGEMNGQPFIAMQYIEGRSLADIGDDLTLEQRVRIVQQIAVAVHEAHRLGIIHRDIKPANILVERQAGGALKPYILDFGLARKVGERGHTQTGVVLGTLHYMSPEQARGDWRTIDRRADVFGLGATLYDLIAGRPPFVSEHPWKLLGMVMNGDAPPLSGLKKGLPRDLSTIVMKCLEREPARRYDSARALAEDLQSFLDGAAIRAKAASFVGVLRKKARRHRVATALLGMSLGGGLVLGGVWLHGQRQAEERATLARQLGESVKEMELFLRLSYAMPLHDVERERDIVRARLADLEARVAGWGEAGAGPGHGALGQGYLALDDPERARAHLEEALSAGYSTPELEHALGRALGELFRRALAETKRITNEEERKRKISELERELRDPALAHLRAAVGSKIEVPEYAEGLIALHEGRHDDAVGKARDAFAKAPWMYEAKKLEGDALFAEGSKYRHDAAFDYDKMRSFLDPAAQAYAAAARMGRSDPAVHLAECELWEKIGQAAWNKELPFDAPFGEADAACERAVEASSKDGRALVQRALVLAARVHAGENDVSEEALARAEEAWGAAEESALARPADIMAHYAVALALRLRAVVQRRLGLEPSMDAAIEAYERVLAMDARFTWAHSELGEAYAFEAEREEEVGRDGSLWAERAIRQFEEAIALDQKFVLPVGGRLKLRAAQIERRIERGGDAEPFLRALFGAVEELEKAGFGPWLATYWKARVLHLRARHELAWGRDPRPPAAEAVRAIVAFAGASTKDYWLLKVMADCHIVEATYALQEGDDPQPFLLAAREAAGRAPEGEADLAFVSAQIELIAARAAQAGNKARPEAFDSALARLSRLLEKPSLDPDAFALSAEIFARRARARQLAGQSPDADIEGGLAMADRALAARPTMARALLAKGYLHLLQARARRPAAERARAARRAAEAFDAAFRHNPLLVRQHGGASEEAKNIP